MRDGLRTYLEAEIIPRYRHFDKAHQEDHVRSVITQALELARYYDVDLDLVYTAAAYHDTGLAVDRASHHLESGKIVRADTRLRDWFSAEEIETIAQAAEDHRASAKTAPRSIYGRLIAESDRLIDPLTVIRRTIQFGLSHYPDLPLEGQWERTLEHLREKYGDGGYLQLWIPESPNAARLEELRKIIRKPETLRSVFDKLFAEETATGRA
ncbi:MAG: HD domain-containing protein [Bacteroidales bacterium]|nr:HD domain-containing protein [Bacteroidales bacterium]